MMNDAPVERTERYLQRLQVALSYEVVFTRGICDPDNPVMSEILHRQGCRRILVFLDSGLVDHWPDLPEWFERYLRHHRLDLAAAPTILPGGEKVKDGWTHTGVAIDEIQRNRLCRHSVVLAAGGGALIDTVGFAASLVHRGVRLVRVPTTTLAQGDSGVGVKNGVNFKGIKNLLGVFDPPFAVINDLDFLRTLEPELVLDGIAEAFKVAIIKDAEFFRFLLDSAGELNRGDSAEVHEAVRRSGYLHLDHIAKGGDPFEVGNSRPLDFGHWSAHWLEGVSCYAVRHGQAVAIGIALDTFLAADLGLITEPERDEILLGLESSGLPIWHPLLASRDVNGDLRVLNGLDLFREHHGGTLSITLPQGLGQRIEIESVDTQAIERGVAFLNVRASA